MAWPQRSAIVAARESSVESYADHTTCKTILPRSCGPVPASISCAARTSASGRMLPTAVRISFRLIMSASQRQSLPQSAIAGAHQRIPGPDASGVHPHQDFPLAGVGDLDTFKNDDVRRAPVMDPRRFHGPAAGRNRWNRVRTEAHTGLSPPLKALAKFKPWRKIYLQPYRAGGRRPPSLDARHVAWMTVGFVNKRSPPSFK